MFGDFGFVHKTSDGGASWQQAYVNVADEHPAGFATPQKQYYHSVGIGKHNLLAGALAGCKQYVCAVFLISMASEAPDGGHPGALIILGILLTHVPDRETCHGNTMFAATSGVHDMYQSTRLQDALLDANDAGGRIIYSTNNGAAWQLLHQFNHPVFWVATDPNNANRMYASVIHYGDGAGQGGIWMTNDLNNLAASIWTKLPNPPRTEGHPACIVVLNDGKDGLHFFRPRTSGGTFTASSGVFIYDPVGNHGQMYRMQICNTGQRILLSIHQIHAKYLVCRLYSADGAAHPMERADCIKTTNRGASWTKLTGTQFDRVTSITFNPALLNQAYLTTETQGLMDK